MARSSPRSTPPRRSTSTSSSPPYGEPRKGLQDIIQGSATAYAGRGAEANETYKYLSPSLSRPTGSSERSRDRQVLTDFLVNGAAVVTGAGRAPQRSLRPGLQHERGPGRDRVPEPRLDRAFSALPPAMRQANTTFFNLRARPGRPRLLRRRHPRPPPRTWRRSSASSASPSATSVPVFHDLRLAVRRKGQEQRPRRCLRPDSTRSQRGASRPVPGERCGAGRLRPAAAVPAPLLAGPLAGARRARPDHRLLRRRRPLRPGRAAGSDLRATTATNELRPDPSPRRFADPVVSDAAATNASSSAAVRAAPPRPYAPDANPSSTWRASIPAPPADCNATDVPPGP